MVRRHAECVCRRHGTAIDTIVLPGGTAFVSWGGVAVDTTVSSGSAAFGSSGGVEQVSSGYDAANVILLAGGIETVLSGAIVTALPNVIERLSENGGCYIARDTRRFARGIGLEPRATPIESAQSNGVAEGDTACKAKTGKKRGLSNLRGGMGTPSRTVGLLGAIFTYGVRKRTWADNPVHGVTRPADGRRERRLSDLEYAALGTALCRATVEYQAAMGAMPNKTDRNDARGIAQITRTGWYRAVHVKRARARFAS